MSHLNEEQQANFVKDVNSARMGAKLQGFQTIKCFSTFQAMVFSPENMTIKVSARLRVCEESMYKLYGSYELFKSHVIVVDNLNQISLR